MDQYIKSTDFIGSIIGTKERIGAIYTPSIVTAISYDRVGARPDLLVFSKNIVNNKEIISTLESVEYWTKEMHEVFKSSVYKRILDNYSNRHVDGSVTLEKTQAELERYQEIFKSLLPEPIPTHHNK